MNRPAAYSPIRALIAATWLLLTSVACDAAMLYATSIRRVFSGSATTIECNLYKVDAATGASELIAPVRLEGSTSVGVVSLAVSPSTGVLYGVTARQENRRPSLVTIDPATGYASAVGILAHTVSDIGFDSDGRLYGWLPDENRLAEIDVGRAVLTPLAPSGIRGVMGGGMAIGAHHVAYVAATGAGGTLDTIDMATGAGKTGPQLDGAPYLSAITNLTISPDGKLYAVNSNMGSPASTALVTVDPASGRVHEVGRLPPDSHGLIFLPQDVSTSHVRPMYVAAAVVVIAMPVGLLLMRRKRRKG